MKKRQLTKCVVLLFCLLAAIAGCSNKRKTLTVDMAKGNVILGDTTAYINYVMFRDSDSTVIIFLKCDPLSRSFLVNVFDSNPGYCYKFNRRGKTTHLYVDIDVTSVTKEGKEYPFSQRVPANEARGIITLESLPAAF